MSVKFVLAALALILFLSGCAQDPTVNVTVYVNDNSGRPVNGASVSAYSNYSLGTGAQKFTALDGTITATGTTRNGQVSLQILPGNYAFKAIKGDARGGEEKLILTGNNSVHISLSSPRQPF